MNTSDAEASFVELAKKRLAELSPLFAKALKDAGLEGHPIELFFFPVPSVTKLRDLFQEKIGWSS
jgi:hypothetical protein